MKGLLRSFAGGEIAPEMFGRLDLGKYQTGLQLARNGRTLAHGPWTRRPGFAFVNEVKYSVDQPRLIPFVFNADQAYVIELGYQTARFHSAGGSLLEPNVPIDAITQANPGIFTRAAHGYVSGDWVFINNVVGMTALNSQFYVVVVLSANTYRLTYLDGTAVDTSALPAYGGSGVTARVYTVATPWTSAALSGLTFSQDSDVLTVCSPLFATQEIRRLAATNWTVTPASFTPTLAPPGGVSVTETVRALDPLELTDQEYVVTSIGTDGITESVASTTVVASNSLVAIGSYNTIDWSAAVGASRYYVYKLRGGAFGYIGQTTDLTFVDDNILPDATATPPQNFTSLNTGVGDFPRTVTHLEQRRWFAGTVNGPQNVWGTRNGTDSNLTSSIPARADDALAFRIRAQQQNAIRHLVPLIDLLALTAGGVVRIFPDPGPALAPDTLSIKPQSYSGASTVQPALADDVALYVQAQGARIRELAFDPSGFGRYKSNDVSLFAPHLFNGFQTTELSYTRAPDQTLWGIRNDGALLGLTHVPEQQVYGWHHHDTDGFFESCATIPEGGEDVLYVIVRRVINGRTVRYIERLASRIFTDPNDAFFVDCGVTYDGDPIMQITGGLRHLEGKTVQILADGAVKPEQVVTNGGLPAAFDTEVSKVHIGLKFTSDMQTLPAVFDQAAMGQGTMKNVSKVYLRVTQSSLVKAGPSFDKLTDYPARAVSDPYGSPPALRTGELSLPIGPSWNTDGTVCVRQDQPLPLTVLSLTFDTALGG